MLCPSAKNTPPLIIWKLPINIILKRGYVIALYRIPSWLLFYELDNMLSEVEEDIFENSIKMSYQYLDQYYSQTKDQAKRRFGITVAVSVFGALLIGVGIVAMFMGKMEPSYVACASGVITEFISAVFFICIIRQSQA